MLLTCSAEIAMSLPRTLFHQAWMKRFNFLRLIIWSLSIKSLASQNEVGLQTERHQAWHQLEAGRKATSLPPYLWQDERFPGSLLMTLVRHPSASSFLPHNFSRLWIGVKNSSTRWKLTDTEFRCEVKGGWLCGGYAPRKALWCWVKLSRLGSSNASVRRDAVLPYDG